MTKEHESASYRRPDFPFVTVGRWSNKLLADLHAYGDPNHHRDYHLKNEILTPIEPLVRTALLTYGEHKVEPLVLNGVQIKRKEYLEIPPFTFYNGEKTWEVGLSQNTRYRWREVQLIERGMLFINNENGENIAEYISAMSIVEGYPHGRNSRISVSLEGTRAYAQIVKAIYNRCVLERPDRTGDDMRTRKMLPFEKQEDGISFNSEQRKWVQDLPSL